jgi:serine/threonine protein kinase
MPESSTHDLDHSTVVVDQAPEPRPEAPTLEPGATVGRYRIRSELGSGGMGVVYRAHDPHLERDVALKILRPDRHEGTDGSLHTARMIREARALAQLSHPNVVSIFDVGVADGSVFIAMELVEGQTLRTWLQDGPQPIEEVREVFIQAAKGLIAAHGAHLVHRDFKPGNVLMTRDERGRWICKVVDFGLARPALTSELSGGSRGTFGASSDRSGDPVTELGTVVGTPAYMAPEQHRGAEVGPAAD